MKDATDERDVIGVHCLLTELHDLVLSVGVEPISSILNVSSPLPIVVPALTGVLQDAAQDSMAEDCDWKIGDGVSIILY